MKNKQIILGIETSCDETACAIMQKDGDRVTILSNIVASSAELQAKYGGVIPEQAAREQLLSIIPVVEEALSKAFISHKPYTINNTPPIDAIAVTEGPGLIGSLLVGVETAKTLSLIWNKPLIPVNHLRGHFYANWIDIRESASQRVSKSATADTLILRHPDVPTFPCLGLLVSGGHTDLILFTDHGKYKYLGGTRDDAAGECFDKCARLLGLPYPGGPNLSKLAEEGNPKAYNLPRPMLDSKDLDFSFSGLKTAVNNQINQLRSADQQVSKSGSADTLILRSSDMLANLAASIEDAITDILVEKTVTAVQLYNIDQIIVAGGVAANKTLSSKLTQSLSEIIPHAKVFIPPPSLCTDNAASIATAAFFNPSPINPLHLQANPNISLDNNSSHQ
ncbi:MAG: tRNA (adenosine(37)-N6)-threonylcarbamoyltransferase complex transferase subunit TsaD [Candidatus Daviesbacteria bacterium]|nr:tRNA (adenosine(37)-N6)-threonylcarbamoyltransferase complex transferase subunit TsaD [Candidatus Daviesbacteria bacterium]